MYESKLMCILFFLDIIKPFFSFQVSQISTKLRHIIYGHDLFLHVLLVH